MDQNRSRLLLYVILALTLIRGITYASLTPPWQAPDEPKHFEYVALLEQEGHLVTRADASPSLQNKIISSMKLNAYWTFGYANSPEQASTSFADIWKASPSELDRPPLYYLAASIVYLPLADIPIDMQLYVLRLFSVLLGVLTVLMIFLAVRTAFPRDPPLALLASSFVAFLPMHSFISSSVNSDNLANLIAAILAYIVARIFMKGASLADSAAVVGLLFAGFWTKRTTLFTVPVSLLLAPVYLGRTMFRRRLWPAFAAVAVLLVSAVGSVFVLDRPREWVTLGLDRYIFNYSASSNLSSFNDNIYTLDSLLELYSGFSRHVFESFWAQFGWMNVRLDSVWYDVLTGLSLLSLLGMLNFARMVVLKRQNLDARQARVLAIYLVWIVLVIAVAYIQYTPAFSASSFPQGRYLFPALGPLALYFALGLKNLSPKRFQPSTLFAVISGLFLFDTLSMMLYIVPFYYLP